MKRPYLLVFLLFIVLTSCKDDAVELTRGQLMIGNWYEYMVTEKYVDNNGKVQDEIRTAVLKPMKVSRFQIIRGEHADAYNWENNGEQVAEKCNEKPLIHEVKGITTKHQNWMSWTSEEENVNYKVGNETKSAAKVIRTVEYKRMDVVN